jgi:hypothetical protein
MRRHGTVQRDCQATYRIDTFRSEKRREFRVRLRIRDGGCRALLPRYDWISLPALPRGWAVRFTHERVPDDAPVDLRE